MANIPGNVAGQIELGWMPCLEDVRHLREDWTGITSTAERRRLQNRLNQRAYRRRRKHGETGQVASAAVTDTTSHNTTTLVSRDQESSSSCSPQTDYSGFNVRRNCETHVRRAAAMRLFAQLAHDSYMRGTPEPSHLFSLIQYNVHTALMRNSDTLGLSDAWLDYDAISPFCREASVKHLRTTTFIAPQDWPPTLRPTPLQLRIEHHPWIDLFPLPRMRDNFLRAIEDPDICDEDELCHDIAQFGGVDKPCLIVWGQPWDPRSWEASLSFLRKWGWLLDGCWEIVEATNYWRKKRGEKGLTREEVLDAMSSSRPKFFLF